MENDEAHHVGNQNTDSCPPLQGRAKDRLAGSRTQKIPEDGEKARLGSRTKNTAG